MKKDLRVPISDKQTMKCKISEFGTDQTQGLFVHFWLDYHFEIILYKLFGWD